MSSFFTEPEILRAVGALAAKAGMEPVDYLDLARLGLLAWQPRRRPIPLWRVGLIRQADGRAIKCVMGQGLTLRAAIEQARPWAAEAMAGRGI